jgi:hypothetical protein
MLLTARRPPVVREPLRRRPPFRVITRPINGTVGREVLEVSPNRRRRQPVVGEAFSEGPEVYRGRVDAAGAGPDEAGMALPDVVAAAIGPQAADECAVVDLTDAARHHVL